MIFKNVNSPPLQEIIKNTPLVFLITYL